MFKPDCSSRRLEPRASAFLNRFPASALLANGQGSEGLELEVTSL
jgi:hypothetical protein